MIESTDEGTTLIVISATEGPTGITKTKLRNQRNLHFHSMEVLLTDCEKVDDNDLLDLVEMEIRELLDECGFPGDDIPIRRNAEVAQTNGQPEPWAWGVMGLCRYCGGRKSIVGKKCKVCGKK